MLMALLVSCLDIALNSVWRWDFEVGMSSFEKINKLRIRDDSCRVVAFSYPLCNVGTDICESKEKYHNNCTYVLELRGCVCTMRVGDRSLFLVGKATEDITTLADSRLPLYSHIDSLIAKAVDCMMPEIGSQ